MKLRGVHLRPSRGKDFKRDDSISEIRPVFLVERWIYARNMVGNIQTTMDEYVDEGQKLAS